MVALACGMEDCFRFIVPEHMDCGSCPVVWVDDAVDMYQLHMSDCVFVVPFTFNASSTYEPDAIETSTKCWGFKISCD